ncbi:asparagine synthetase B [Hahella sp. KA22]|uniref:asparagine synthase-related protein n=1 Tax=Hahella sp. KA22 TaxID=1628392 RepID=UPI000FDD72A1|nr:asparagine synthase-related protein [Hahella sp. KA22]AZZ94475.1 asparagine synthetase B [Hahella sp. KA22]QAY57848.1 asparagine synthetase B [Hahella sp. KA22]
MSGIAGVYQCRQPVSETSLRAMADAMKHRGPDGSNIWLDTRIGFCHNMLYTTPESLFEQLPAVSHDNQIAITADVRLDNREELFALLRPERLPLNRLSDSQLILMAYLRWGQECLDRLLGEYALAIWDKRNDHLLIAVDPMGTCSLHYVQTSSLFAFATDIKALLAVPGVEKKLDEWGFALQVSGHKREAPERTCFAGVKRLVGGELMLIKPPGENRAAWKVNKQAYYELKPATLVCKSPEETLDAFRETFRQAVRCRMRSAYPVATMLSGGLDSSSVTCVAAEYSHITSSPLFSVSSCVSDADPEEDEKRYIDIVARHNNLPVHYITPSSGPASWLHQVHDMTATPINSNPHVYTALYSKIREGGGRIVLDGVAGEWGPSYNGDGYLLWLLTKGRWKTLFNTMSELSSVYSIARGHLLRREILSPLEPSLLRRIRHTLRGYNQQERLPPLNPRLHYRSQTKAGGQGFLHSDMRSNRLHTVATGRTPKEWYAPYYQVRSSFPYLDLRVQRFCLGLTEDWFIKDGWKRYFIRAAMENILPAEVQWRKDKKPFSPSYYRLMQMDSEKYQTFLQSIQGNDPVRDYIDVNRISRTIKTLDRRGSWRPYQGVDFARRVVDYGVQSIAFLQWFQRL